MNAEYLDTESILVAGSVGSARPKKPAGKTTGGALASPVRTHTETSTVMPSDIRERVWEVLSHNGDFQRCQNNDWEIVGLQEIPVALSTILQSPLYQPYVLQVAEEEKRLNSEAEELHGKLYGRDYFHESMRHQLMARYHEIDAGRRLRGLCPRFNRRSV